MYHEESGRLIVAGAYHCGYCSACPSTRWGFVDVVCLLKPLLFYSGWYRDAAYPAETGSIVIISDDHGLTWSDSLSVLFLAMAHLPHNANSNVRI